jgi:opacity protein-like surface antigen
MNTKNAILAAALALAAPFVHAAGPGPLSPESGFYVGLGLGKATAKDWCSEPALGGGATRCDDKDTTWRMLAGYQFTRNFAVEGGYHDLGRVQFTRGVAETTLKANAWELNGIAALPVGGIVSVYGKLGLFRRRDLRRRRASRPLRFVLRAPRLAALPEHRRRRLRRQHRRQRDRRPRTV